MSHLVSKSPTIPAGVRFGFHHGAPYGGSSRFGPVVPPVSTPASSVSQAVPAETQKVLEEINKSLKVLSEQLKGLTEKPNGSK